MVTEDIVPRKSIKMHVKQVVSFETVSIFTAYTA